MSLTYMSFRPSYLFFTVAFCLMRRLNTASCQPFTQAFIIILHFKTNGLQPQTRNSPVIVGDQYELAEAVAEGYVGQLLGGLWGRPDSQTALLSMSGYEKFQGSDLGGYDTRSSSQAYASLADYNAARPKEESMYLTYVLPGLADPELQPPSTVSYDSNADQMAYGASSLDQSHAFYEATQSVYNGYQTSKPPKVSSYNPQRGSEGSVIYVYIDSDSDLLAPSPLIASLMFATRRVPATLSRLGTREHDVCYKYVATANAPAFAETGSPNSRLSMRLQLQETNGVDTRLIDVGPWVYDSGKQYEPQLSPEANRKRKMVDQSIDLSSSTKRVLPSHQQTSDKHDHGSCGYLSDTNMGYPQSLHSIDLSSMQRKLTPYGRAQSQRSSQDENSTMGSHNRLSNAASSQSLMRPPTTQTSAWSPSSTVSSRSGKGPAMSTQGYQTSFSVRNLVNPPLVRATTLQAQSSSAFTSGASSSDGNFNPYALYQNKANIKIRGDLSVMQDKWSAEERVAKRRLVLFRGEQSGSTINTYFEAVNPEERPSPRAARERRVSCIYWEERDEYFVTSVDTIALLETLVGARFTVEEKNRIRRNLETHHPLTVSKGKADTESFFKVIMGFPNPKPRNIEKDVKVFPWPILAQALRKVISKYSASPASTAELLNTTRPSHYIRAQSEQATEPYLSSSSSTTSSTYTQALKSATLSPPAASPHGLPSAYSPLNTYTVPTLASQYPHHDAAKPLASSYNSQASVPELSHAYTNSVIGRRRSSEAGMGILASSPYAPATRPRANTSFASLYATQDTSSASAWQPPTAGQAVHGAWDFSSFINPNSDSGFRRDSIANTAQGAGLGYTLEEADQARTITSGAT